MKKFSFEPVSSVPGFRAGSIVSGIKVSGLKDLVLIVSDTPAVGAGVFTKNQVPSPSVVFSQNVLKKSKTVRAVLVNSGNANACTGKQGFKDCQTLTAKAAEALGIAASEVLYASTGVIGKLLPVPVMLNGIPKLADALTADGWPLAAEGIMTTDLVPKSAQVKLKLGGKTVTLAGITKGSGMIHPDMATMLGFVATDAAIDRKALQSALRTATDSTFNNVTVDGECSTNDCVIALANGHAGNKPVKSVSADYKKFLEALTELCRILAWKIVEDGEGATKFVTVRVAGAKTALAAKKVAQRVAISSLVKTAMFGQDPNWGRILAAAGHAGVAFDHEAIEIRLGGFALVKKGQPVGAPQEALKAVMREKNIFIELFLKQGKHQAEVYTCDLSYDYVKINAEYTT